MACATTENLDWLSRNGPPGIWEREQAIYKQLCPSEDPCPAEAKRVPIYDAEESEIFWSVLPWMHEYLRLARHQLQNQARGCMVETQEIILPAIRAALEADCVDGSCSSEALRAIPSMAKLLSAQVEKAIDEVSVLRLSRT